MARRTPQTLTPRWRRRVWNASEPPFSYKMVTFYVLVHMPYLVGLWIVLNAFRLEEAGFDLDNPGEIHEMMYWFRVTAWLLLGWTVALGVSTVLPWQRRTRGRLPIVVLAVLISWLLVEAAYSASEIMEDLPYPERFDVFEFRYDPVSQKWFYQP